MPQPFLRFLPSRLFPAEDRAPLSGPPAPLLLFTDRAKRTSRTLSALVSLPHTPKRACQRPPTPMGSLSSRQKTRVPVPLGSSGLTASCDLLHQPRSFTPFASPYPTAWVSPKLKAEALLEFLPFEVFPAHDLDPQPNLPRRQLLTSPEGSVRTQRTSRPFQPGEAIPFE
jgi:hypothetical protein